MLPAAALFHLLAHRLAQPGAIGALARHLNAEDRAALGVGGQLHVDRRIETAVGHLHHPGLGIGGAYAWLTLADLFALLAQTSALFRQRIGAPVRGPSRCRTCRHTATAPPATEDRSRRGQPRLGEPGSAHKTASDPTAPPPPVASEPDGLPTPDRLDSSPPWPSDAARVAANEPTPIPPALDPPMPRSIRS